jgi:hypothetical protein
LDAAPEGVPGEVHGASEVATGGDEAGWLRELANRRAEGLQFPAAALEWVALSVVRACAGLSRGDERGRFSGMSATLTVNLDSEILQLAEQEARARHTTLPEVVARQLRVMARNWQESRAGKTPATDALRGAVELPPDFDERAALTEELRKKHGVQG